MPEQRLPRLWTENGRSIMDREQYNECMKPYISGKKAKEERKLDFCIGAKVCSGKAKSEEEARHICLTAPKAPPKTKAPKRKDCSADMIELAGCVIKKLSGDLTEAGLAEAMQLCACGKAKKTTRVEKAMAQITPEQMEALAIIGQITDDYKDTHWEDNFGMGK